MRTKKGIIGSTKMTGTVSVTVNRFVLHPIYKKRFKQSRKFLADTNSFDLFVGDEVEITECRPLSKNKYFKVTSIIKAAPRVADINSVAANPEDVIKSTPTETTKKKTIKSSHAQS